MTVSGFNVFGDFGDYSYLALGIVLASLVGLYYLGRWAGIRGIHWLWPWLFCLAIGEIALAHQRALSGYLVLLGMIGTMTSILAAMRRHIPQ